MISLAPLKEKEKIDLFFSKAKLEINENSGCVAAMQNDEVLGFCLYDLTKDKMIIRHIEPLNDLGLSDGILRSTLHVAAEKSIMNAFYDDTANEEFFAKLNFIKDKSEKSLKIEKLFESCCSCKN